MHADRLSADHERPERGAAVLRPAPVAADQPATPTEGAVVHQAERGEDERQEYPDRGDAEAHEEAKLSQRLQHGGHVREEADRRRRRRRQGGLPSMMVGVGETLLARPGRIPEDVGVDKHDVRAESDDDEEREERGDAHLLGSRADREEHVGERDGEQDDQKARHAEQDAPRVHQEVEEHEAHGAPGEHEVARQDVHHLDLLDGGAREERPDASGAPPLQARDDGLLDEPLPARRQLAYPLRPDLSRVRRGAADEAEAESGPQAVRGVVGVGPAVEAPGEHDALHLVLADPIHRRREGHHVDAPPVEEDVGRHDATEADVERGDGVVREGDPRLAKYPGVKGHALAEVLPARLGAQVALEVRDAGDHVGVEDAWGGQVLRVVGDHQVEVHVEVVARLQPPLLAPQPVEGSVELALGEGEGIPVLEVPGPHGPVQLFA
mmetsp:Transcript_52855/g.115458  ORF Transcript_52855/g.115458 Transcript_52855/m.115458 type:complete len:437 (+) Transcript_52855:313-1623(+)